MKRSAAIIALIVAAAATTPSRAQDYPYAADQGHHHHQRRRDERHLHARARRRAAQALGPAADHREPPRRHAMNVGTRACAEAPPDGYTICITNADAMLYNQFLFKNMPFDPEKEAAAGHQRLSPDPHAGGELESRRQERRRAYRAVEGQGRHAVSYLAPGAAARALHGDAEEGEGRGLGARAVQGGGEAVNAILSGIDADRAVRRGQRHRQDPAPAR